MIRPLLKHEDYLSQIVEAARKHGREGLQPIHYEGVGFGFRTPDGLEFLLSMDELRAYFDVEGERGPDGFEQMPPFDVIQSHILMVEDAIAEGLRIRAMH